MAKPMSVRDDHLKWTLRGEREEQAEAPRRWDLTEALSGRVPTGAMLALAPLSPPDGMKRIGLQNE